MDHPDWNEVVTGLSNPMIQDGFVEVPEKPGLGFDDINEEMCRKYLDPRDPIYFDQPTDAWDSERSWDRLWS